MKEKEREIRADQHSHSINLSAEQKQHTRLTRERSHCLIRAFIVSRARQGQSPWPGVDLQRQRMRFARSLRNE